MVLADRMSDRLRLAGKPAHHDEGNARCLTVLGGAVGDADAKVRLLTIPYDVTLACGPGRSAFNARSVKTLLSTRGNAEA